MTLPYIEGSVFLVPLRNGGYARGVVARTSDEGKVLLGYFFGPQLKEIENATVDDLDPAKAILRIRFGDLGLLNGSWKIIGTVADWSRTDWPVPQFVRRDTLSRKAWVVRYSDSDPNKIEAESPTDLECALTNDSLSGYGAVEIKLTKLLEGASG